MSFTDEQIYKEALKRLVNGCKNIESGRLVIATCAHSAVDSIHMLVESGEETATVSFVCNGEDMLAVINLNNPNKVELMYEEEHEFASFITIRSF